MVVVAIMVVVAVVLTLCQVWLLGGAVVLLAILAQPTSFGCLVGGVVGL